MPQAVSNGIGGKHIDIWMVGDSRFLVLDENGSEQVDGLSAAGLLVDLLEEGIIGFPWRNWDEMFDVTSHLRLQAKSAEEPRERNGGWKGHNSKHGTLWRGFEVLQ